VNIPPGCEAPLGGEWLHAAAPTWRYLGEDDGGSLVLTVSRVRSDGGTGAPGEGGPRVELRRTAEGFVGQVQDSTFGPGDTRCAVRFPTQVVACAPDRLTLSTAARAFVDEQCNPAPQAGPARQDVHELVRPPPGAPPAASPAASPPPGASAPPAPVASPAPDAGTP
jgi:hypothetical protein